MRNGKAVVLRDTDDMALLRDAARRSLARHWPADKAVAFAEDPAELRRFFEEAAGQGWTGIGLAAGEDELALAVVLMDELGRGACPIPLADALLLRDVLSADETGDGASVVRGIENGSVIPAWIFGPAGGEEGGAGFRVEDSGDGLTLHGPAAYVENASLASHFVVLTGRPREVAIVPAGAAGLTVTRTPGLSRPALSSVRFDGAKPQLVLRVAAEKTDAIPSLARLLLVARSLGAASRGLDMLVAYARERVQFGKKIGQFQAIQHKLANCLLGIETTRLAIYRAASESGEARDYARAAAAAVAGQTLRTVVMELHHGFGGISFWENHEMPRHFRRIHSDLTRLGGPYAARREVAGFLFDGATGRLPDIDFGPRVNDFRLEVRAWLGENWKGWKISSEETRYNHIRADRSFSLKLAAKGWLTLHWPKEYGGQERPALDRLVLEEELAYVDAPIKWHDTAVNMLGPALLRYGSEEHRDLVMAVGRGEVSFALGYSEPANGSDLAGMKTTATRTNEGWTIRGQKTFTSAAGFADYCWLAARTGPPESQQGGISVFIVPLRGTPGLTIQPMYGLNGHDSNTVFYDDVKLPPEAIVGGVNQGWQVITAALAHERVSLGAIGARARGYFDRLVQHVNTTSRNGRPMREDPVLRDRLASLAADVQGSQLLAAQSALVTESGKVPLVEAALLKVHASELLERLASEALDILGPGAMLSSTVDETLLEGEFEYSLRDSLLYTIGGGTNEIQRNLIAIRGLGLPR
jgi:alkylation response protein AidB-like acyl-CoA dehydrogenase